MGRTSRDDYQWLVDELLKLEEDEIEEEIDAENPKWWEEDEEGRNPGWSYGVYDDEEFDEDAAILAESPRQRKKRIKQEKQQAKAEKKRRKKEKKQKGIGGLVLLAILEVFGILAIIGWWIQWLT